MEAKEPMMLAKEPEATTCEQYVLDELRKCKEELAAAKKELESHSTEKMVADKIVCTIYYVTIRSVCDYGDDLTLDTLKSLMTNDSLLDEFNIMASSYGFGRKAYTIIEDKCNVKASYEGRDVYIEFFKDDVGTIAGFIFDSTTPCIHISRDAAVAYGRKEARKVIAEIIAQREKAAK